MAISHRRTRTFSRETYPGLSAPLGASVEPEGVNFSLFARHADEVELAFFDEAEDGQPSRRLRLDARRNKTDHYWHIFVTGVQPGQLYGFYVRGRGRRFDGDKLLLDPYGKAVAVPKTYEREAGARPGDNTERAMKSVVVDISGYDWGEDLPIHRPFSETVIYELHVGGLTRHPSSGLDEELRGTFAGLVEKIPHLVELGVTAVELLPVFQFDEQEARPGLVNYWGYNPVSFFAPHIGYGVGRDPRGVIDEFRDMVKALHRAGIEVILDVVFNHTAEGNDDGPTFCFKGLANEVYYHVDEAGDYRDYSGTGNSLNANHAVVRRLILDSLVYWVREMHVDGFRFDLASILSRDQSGQPMKNPPVLWAIESEPVLAGTKLIAEAWDAVGLYQVGQFTGERWMEWNGAFRDEIRSFVRGDSSTVERLASRLLGSPDIYGHREREPELSVNFVSCHDGFTINDVVSYNSKHNEANGEQGRDGHSDNRSWNCGVEGPSDDPAIEALRNRQVKNLLALNFLALGTPMILMGDEMRRSQGGNNNAYCQDNEIGWLDWSLLERHADIHRFLRGLIRLRLGSDWARGRGRLDLMSVLSRADVRWHGVRLNEPDFAEHSRSLATTIRGLSGQYWIHLIANAYWEPLRFELPLLPGAAGTGWRRIIDTALEPPDDICEWSVAPLIDSMKYKAAARSVVLLISYGNRLLSQLSPQGRG